MKSQDCIFESILQEWRHENGSERAANKHFSVKDLMPFCSSRLQTLGYSLSVTTVVYWLITCSFCLAVRKPAFHLRDVKKLNKH